MGQSQNDDVSSYINAEHTEKPCHDLELVDLLSKETHCCYWATPGESQTSSVTCEVGQKLSHTTTLAPWCFISCSEANKSLMAVHRSRSHQNSGCNISLTHRWNEKQIARWTGGTFAELGGVKVRDDQLRLCVCDILIWCSCTMIRLIYVATPVLNKSAKANNCAHDFRRWE